VQPLGSVPAFYGTRRFITEFTRALHSGPRLFAVLYITIIIIIKKIK
jgi:hypothetical protein